MLHSMKPNQASVHEGVQNLQHTIGYSKHGIGAALYLHYSATEISNNPNIFMQPKCIFHFQATVQLMIKLGKNLTNLNKCLHRLNH